MNRYLVNELGSSIRYNVNNPNVLKVWAFPETSLLLFKTSAISSTVVTPVRSTVRDVASAKLWGHGIEFIDSLTTMGKIRTYQADRNTPYPNTKPRWEEYMTNGNFHMEFITGGRDDSENVQMILTHDSNTTSDIILPAAYVGKFAQSSDATEISAIESSCPTRKFSLSTEFVR